MDTLGKLEVLEWAESNGCPWDNYIRMNAAGAIPALSSGQFPMATPTTRRSDSVLLLGGTSGCSSGRGPTAALGTRYHVLAKEAKPSRGYIQWARPNDCPLGAITVHELILSSREGVISKFCIA